MSTTQGSPELHCIRPRSDRRSHLEARATVTPWLQGLAVAGLLLGAAGSARADAVEAPPPPEAPSPKNYVTAVIGTTLAYKPNSGDFGGPLKDIDPAIGYGRLITPTVALELDVGLVFIKTDYSSFLFVPGVVWNFSTHVYAAMRFLVPVDPEVNFALFPGIGLAYTLPNGISLSLELNPNTTIGRGKPDFGLPLTGGVVYSF